MNISFIANRFARHSQTSAWNHAGTWEEKDTTEWCKGVLTEVLSSVGAERGSLEAACEVEKVEGDASVGEN